MNIHMRGENTVHVGNTTGQMPAANPDRMIVTGDKE